MFDEPEAVVAEVLESLRKKTLREYFRRDFFTDHLSRYSKSRLKAPIYWPLSTPSRNWGLWVYAPTFSREGLFAIAGEAARRGALAAEAIRRLEAEREGRAGRSARELNAALAAEESLAGELERFKA